MITHRNYIEYFVDYYDGNLSDDVVKELFAFLDKNPDLKSEFEEYGEAVVPELAVTMPETLHSGVREKNAVDEFELACIKYLEGEVDKDSLLRKAANDSRLLHTISLYEKTKVSSGGIVYPYKEKLLKKRSFPLLKTVAVVLPALLLIPLLINDQPVSHYKPRDTFYTSINSGRKLEANPTKASKKSQTNTASYKASVEPVKSSGKTSGKDVLRADIPPYIAQAQSVRLTTISYDITYLPAKKKTYSGILSERHGLAGLKFKGLSYIGLSLFHKQELKIKFKDNRLSYFTLNTKNFFVKIKKTKS